MTPGEKRQREQARSEENARVFQARVEGARRALATHDGKLLLELLEWKFDGSVLGTTPEQSHAKAAAREVVRYLRRTRDRKE